MKIQVSCSREYHTEREYICHIVLDEFLGVKYSLCFEERSDWQLSVFDQNSLTIPDLLFQIPQKMWLQSDSLPVQPLSCCSMRNFIQQFKIVAGNLPVIYGDLDFQKRISAYSSSSPTDLVLPIDIFGSAFFMLSRYEEAVKKERDEHGRFPATASLAYQEGFLDRPIVNEYVEILWVCMKKLWPGLKRKKRKFQMQVSCDVDHVYQEGIKAPLRQLRHIGGDLFCRKSPRMAFESAINYFISKTGNYSFDPNFSALEWIMDVNEKAGNRVLFNFKAGKTHPIYDTDYSLDESIVRKLLRRIYERGHKIGFHPSYNTYNDKEQFCREADNLRRVLDEEGIREDCLGGRQHYLRWETPITARLWEAAGLDYDSTLAFADHAGFRSGVCYEYPLYDLHERRMLRVKERPLVVMEGTLLGNCYMNLSMQEGETFIKNIRKTIEIFAGNFELLWHNSNLIDDISLKIYKQIILDKSDSESGL